MTQENGKTADSGKESPFSSKINYDELKKLIAFLEEKNLSQFELEVEGFKIKIGRSLANSGNPAPQIISSMIPSPPSTMPASAPEGQIIAPSPEEDKNLFYVTSPMVGTFYRAPSPTSPPFVDIGDTVKKGQTLCIIEAMKLMNEIECEVNGVVVDILVENGKPVEYGQKLFAIKAGA
jgi:acetyl-CoA carboxylase biotin carboxyl carrier protein